MDGVETGAGGSVMNNNIYALYRGDEYIMDGTLQKKWNIFLKNRGIQ